MGLAVPSMHVEDGRRWCSSGARYGLSAGKCKSKWKEFNHWPELHLIWLSEGCWPCIVNNFVLVSQYLVNTMKLDKRCISPVFTSSSWQKITLILYENNFLNIIWMRNWANDYKKLLYRKTGTDFNETQPMFIMWYWSCKFACKIRSE